MYVIRRTTDGAYLARYDKAWLELGDDPSSWTDDRAKAKRFKTLEAAQRLMRCSGQCGFQPAHIEAVQS